MTIDDFSHYVVPAACGFWKTACGRHVGEARRREPSIFDTLLGTTFVGWRIEYAHGMYNVAAMPTCDDCRIGKWKFAPPGSEQKTKRRVRRQ